MGKDPKDFNFQEALKGALKDPEKAEEIFEQIDFDSLKKPIDEEYVNPIVKRRQEQAREKAREEVQPEVQKQIFSELGIDAENTDGAKAWVKRLQGNTEEKDEAYNRIAKQNKELEEKTKTYEEQINEYKNKAERYESVMKMDEYGVKKDYRDDVYDLAQKRVSEDKGLDDVLKEMKKTHGAFFGTAEAGAGVNPDNETPPKTDDEEQKEWEKKFGL